MPKAEQGLGTVRRVFSRAGEVIWWQALLPRELSVAPIGCKRPERYQQPLAEQFTTEDDARAVLRASIAKLRTSPLRTNLGLDAFIAAEIQAREHAAWRKYKHAAKAKRSSSTWRSIDKRWLSKAPWYRWQPKAITLAELQAWFDTLEQRAVGRRGEPLSGSFIHQVRELVRSALERAGVQPNPAEALRLPTKSAPRVPFLDLGGQRRFYASAEVELEDRAMVGCGMGAALRVGELLSLERADVHLDVEDPHLIVRYGGQHHAPPKGSRESNAAIRRVELFEPGLGFFRFWMQKFYRGGVRVFQGPEGGFLSHWAEKFPAWAPIAGMGELTSHIMRHTWAVSMLSGTWGYDPQSLELVQKQLGHSERTTTERYYGAFEVGMWQREVQRMTGGRERAPRRPVTALELLGLAVESAPPARSGRAGSPADGASDGAASAEADFSAASGQRASQPRHSPRFPIKVETAAAFGPPDGAHQARELGRLALEAARAGDPLAARKLVEAVEALLLVLPAEAAELAGGIR